MIGAGHVRDKEVRTAVAIEIGYIGTHGEPGGVRSCLPDDIGKGAIAVVPVEAVGILEVIPDIDVRQSVVIEIPPGYRVAAVPSRDAGGGADIGEADLPGGIGAVVTKEKILAPGIDIDLFAAGPGYDVVILLEASLDPPLVVHQFDRVLLGPSSGPLEVPGQ